jgi:hypothetical protein
MSTTFAEMAETLRQHPQGLTASQFAAVARIGTQTASIRLSRMFLYGHADRVKTPGRPRTNRSFTYRAKEAARV